MGPYNPNFCQKYAIYNLNDISHKNSICSYAFYLCPSSFWKSYEKHFEVIMEILTSYYDNYSYFMDDKLPK